MTSSTTSPEVEASKEGGVQNTRLYQVLGLETDATEADIKKAYRKLALRCHPDKNLEGDPEKTEKFKEINHANSILSDPKKRKIYDTYGEMGLKLMDQFGEKYVRWLTKRWVKWLFMFIGCITCCFCGCCCGCFFCCNCCCGRCAQKTDDSEYYSFQDNASTSHIVVEQGTAETIVGVANGETTAKTTL